MLPHDSKICTVHEDSAKVSTDAKHPITTTKLGFGATSTMSACITACATHPNCMEAQFDSSTDKCYRAKSSKLDDAAYEKKKGSSAMRCELAKKNARSKMCKSFTAEKHLEAEEGEKMALEGKMPLAKDCLTSCAESDGCMEATWDKKGKLCHLSKKAHLHTSKSDAGNYKVLQCIALSDEEVDKAEAIKPEPMANATATTNATEAAEVKEETPEEAKLAEKKAAEAAKAAKAEAEAKALEVENEKQAKKDAAAKVAAAAAAAKAAAEALAFAKTEAGKKAAKKAAIVAAEKKVKATLEKFRLVAEGRVKKEAADKADVLKKLAEAKKQRTEDRLKLAELGMEKRQKSDVWYRKGHLLFAQGIKYQGLLEKLQQSHNKLDAYHFQSELETYSKAFPQGFTSPLEAKDGFTGKTTPAGAQKKKKNLELVEEFMSW